MLTQDIIYECVAKMKLDIKHPVGTVYFDIISQVKYIIKYNDGKTIQFFVPENETAFSVRALDIDQAFKHNLLTLVHCMQ